MSTIENRCKLTDGGAFHCTVDWDVESGPGLCKFQLQEVVPVDCDFLFMSTRACSSRRAHCEAARTAARASLEKARHSNDKVLEALNKLYFEVLNEKEDSK